MKTVSIFVLTLTICSGMAAQERFVSTRDSADAAVSRGTLRLTIAPQVFDELDHLADTLQVETVRCLIGTVHGMTAMIDLGWHSSSTAWRRTMSTSPRASSSRFRNSGWSPSSPSPAPPGR